MAKTATEATIKERAKAEEEIYYSPPADILDQRILDYAKNYDMEFEFFVDPELLNYANVGGVQGESRLGSKKIKIMFIRDSKKKHRNFSALHELGHVQQMRENIINQEFCERYMPGHLTIMFGLNIEKEVFDIELDAWVRAYTIANYLGIEPDDEIGQVAKIALNSYRQRIGPVTEYSLLQTTKAPAK